jgi:putative sigma-54 modulation protein
MQVNITARHIEVSSGLRERIAAQVEGLVEIFDKIATVNVTLSEDHGVPQSDIVFRVNQHDIKSRGQGNSMIQAFDMAYEKAERQLRKYKGKLIGRRSEGADLKESSSIV